MNDVNNNTTVFLCEDTVDGIFTAIYQAWEFGTSRTDVRIQSEDTLSFFETYVQVDTDVTLATKVADSIRCKLSDEVYQCTYQAALSDDYQKASTIYHFLQKAFRVGSSILDRLHDSDVIRVFELSRRVGREAHSYLGFVRFQELTNGVLVARINPKANIVPLIAAHFSDRLSMENWVILDTTRNLAAVHIGSIGSSFAKEDMSIPAKMESFDDASPTPIRNSGYFLTTTITEESLDHFSTLSVSEQEFQDLWDRFFHTISIEERTNPTLQRNLMPLRYRKYMK